MLTNTYSIQESNEVLRKWIENETHGHIARLCDSATKVSLQIYLHSENKMSYPEKSLLNTMETHDGIYYNLDSDIRLFASIYHNAVINADELVCFPKLYTQEQNMYLSFLKRSKGLHNRALEPFYLLSESTEIPWTHSLANKKVLIIHPFVETFEKQMKRQFRFFPKKEDQSQIFLPDQEFIFYKAYNTLAGNRPHKNWFETFKIMINDIEKLDFDIALLGCGGYGLPLSSYISKNLKKKAIYIGGGLQLLFGVVGKRWDTHPLISQSMKEQPLWVRPGEQEEIQNKNSIERGCYW